MINEPLPVEQDELEPARPLPLVEQESVLVMMPSPRSDQVFQAMWCTVDVVAGEVEHVYFEPHFREVFEAMGYPATDAWVENLLDGLARCEYLRRHPR